MSPGQLHELPYYCRFRTCKGHFYADDFSAPPKLPDELLVQLQCFFPGLLRDEDVEALLPWGNGYEYPLVRAKRLKMVMWLRRHIRQRHRVLPDSRQFHRQLAGWQPGSVRLMRQELQNDFVDLVRLLADCEVTRAWDERQRGGRNKLGHVPGVLGVNEFVIVAVQDQHRYADTA